MKKILLSFVIVIVVPSMFLFGIGCNEESITEVEITEEQVLETTEEEVPEEQIGETTSMELEETDKLTIVSYKNPGVTEEILLSKIAEAEMYDQTNKCFEQYKKYSYADILKLAKKMHLLDETKKNKKTKKELCEAITKRHMEALKIVDYLPKKTSEKI